MTVQKFGLELLGPVPVNPDGINRGCEIPYGVTAAHVLSSLVDFVEFLGFMNQRRRSMADHCSAAYTLPAAIVVEHRGGHGDGQ